MAKIQMQGRGNAFSITEMLTKEILNNGISCELIDEVRHKVDNVDIYVRVFEKYYWRSSNRASLTLTVIGSGDLINVSAIGSGGGQGVFFKMSWGAEDDFVSIVERALAENGFN
jgi:hypothetical protein